MRLTIGENEAAVLHFLEVNGESSYKTIREDVGVAVFSIPRMIDKDWVQVRSEEEINFYTCSDLGSRVLQARLVYIGEG